MKTMISKAMMLVAIAAALLSFSPRFGGEGFEILLNGKVLLQQFGKDLNTVKNLQLGQVSANDKLTIRYHHCGNVGKNRVVTIKDGQDRVLKQWRYKDSESRVAEMQCSTQDIITLKKAGTDVFKIYYSSSELPNGRMLASISVGNNDAVSRK
ncbi:MAG: hypothetical protein KTQ13_00845 [Ferruginibacter sp.]|nr:hypothetical protein [Chitinophagaceae bacterium]MBP6286917.1 hypothetical protein [Ferruginibacter sp.]MBU9935169.1 hypothetical protein [Ferruginibacter sp.]